MVLPGKTPRFELNLRLEGPRRPFLRALAVLSGASASAVASGAAKGAFLDLRVMGLLTRKYPSWNLAAHLTATSTPTTPSQPIRDLHGPATLAMSIAAR